MKNPFEIRADILKQAQDLLEGQFEANTKFAYEAMTKLVKSGAETAESFQKLLPKYPTSDEILAQAKKFYSFVETK